MEENIGVVQSPEVVEGWKNKPFRKNMFMFALGTLGRDFVYNFFTLYLVTFVLLTKSLNTAQFSSITIIIIAARIFDAFNDPLMGGIVENTRTKWGKFKPWQLIGELLTGGVIIALFCVDLDGWAFIGFLAFSYFMYSITYTMNDIAYWGMMPTLTSNPRERDLLYTTAQIVIGIGAGASGILVPILTTGSIGTAVFGSAVTGYRAMAILAIVLMIVFQCFTLFGVKEAPLDLSKPREKKDYVKLKDLFRTIFHNDQLLWNALIMLLYTSGPNIVTGGLATMYVYFEFGYEGIYTLIFGALAAVVSALFTFFYPGLAKKYGRDKLLYFSGFAMCLGYILILIVCLTVPQVAWPSFSVLGMTFELSLKYLLFTLAYTFTGFSAGFYMIAVINIVNTIEYNEYRTGKREEPIIFSLRSFTCKLGSALTQGLVSLTYIVAGVLGTTNKISDYENLAEQGKITAEEKLEGIANVISSVSYENKAILISCMCLIPMACIIACMVIFKKFCILNESKMEEILAANAKRKEELEEKTSDEVVTETQETTVEEVKEEPVQEA